MKLSITYVEPYFRQHSPKRREHHDDYLKAYEQHSWHFEGEYPEPLIDERRPAEHEDIKAWRKKVYQPMTKAPCSKVFTSLQKIQKSPDWHITPTKESFPRITEGEDLYTYLFKKYPTFKTIEKYATDVYLRKYLIDAGAICVTLPINIAKNDNEYFQPMAQIINSEYVMEFIPNELFIWDADEKISYVFNNTKYENGFVYYAVTTTHLYRYEQIDTTGKFREAFVYVHNLGVLPAFEIGSVVVEFQKSERKYETRVCGMLPSLNEAVREYSDSQAEMVQHVFSTMYTYESPDCNICRGSGQIPSAEGAITCNACSGKGKFPFNPFEHIIISKDALTDQAPNPPAAYIQKQTEIIGIMDARFKQRIYDALAAVNMEFLAEKPLAQSGVAKQYDAEELNNFVYSVAEDMIYFITMTAYISAKWRYSGLYGDEDLAKMLPNINVPIKYEIVSDTVMLEDITRMTTAKVDSTLVQAAQVEYARRKFSTNPDVAEQVIARMELDPLAGMSDDAILSGSSMGVISKQDIDIHYNINKYIYRAIAEVPNWNDLTRQEKYATLLTYTNANAGTNNQ